MLNRRLLRVKVMQSLYAFFQSEDVDMVKAEKGLMMSIQRVYELYLYYLLLPVELANAAEVQMEEARNKSLPSPEDLNPNRRFVDSYVIKALRKNAALQRKATDLKISWSADTDLVRKLWKKIKDSEVYQNFLEEEDQPAAHRKFVERIYTKFLLDNDDLYQHFQERSIYWDFEDSDYSINMALRYIGKVKAEDRYKTLPEMYKDEEEDDRFVKNLFRKVITNNKENSKLIDEKTQNWEVERIALMDVILMKMAITEFLSFSSIPVKVSLNEYIELSKMFSSQKSKIFINGVLDKLLAQFKRENQLKKTGRGLMQ
ncbi:MAG: transcription antitermination factor NusB [Flavobacteriales bacterium]|nr:transcription antitermination factor NusB [Flavobacteriales bacterium]